jgi:hypothetical protein
MAGMSPVPADQFEAFKRIIDDSKDVIEPASFALQRRRAAKRAKKALRRDTGTGPGIFAKRSFMKSKAPPRVVLLPTTAAIPACCMWTPSVSTPTTC